MRTKKIVTSIYLHEGKAVRGLSDFTVVHDNPVELALSYSNYGADEIIIFDFSTTDTEHEQSLSIIKEISRVVDIPMIGAGNVKRLEDVKKLIYAGCKKAALNLKKDANIQLAEDVCKRFGRDKIAGCVGSVEELSKNDVIVKNFMSEILIISEEVLEDCITWMKQSNIGVASPVFIEMIPVLDKNALHETAALLRQHEEIIGVAGGIINEKPEGIMKLKLQCKGLGIPVNTYESSMKWDEFKLNSDGMLPVVVQDYKTGEVLMVAYMNEEAYLKTVETGIMTYWSRSRNELWVKGATSGHYQYVKALYADCDSDTLLAKVLQIGAACHTGKRSCFFQELMKKEYDDTNPLMVFEKEYNTIMDRKKNPKEGSYTNYLFDKGIDKILKKVGEECTEIIIAAKNPDPEEIKYEIADFLYHAMVLMAEKGVTWEDITKEIAQR